MMVAQTDIWKRTIQSAEQAWASSLTETSDRVRLNWSESVETTVAQLAKGIDRSVVQADESMSNRWKQWQVMLSDNARLMSQQQQELAAQTNALQSLVGKSENEQAVQGALQGALKAIATTEKLTTAIGSLSERVEKLNVVGDAETGETDSGIVSDVDQPKSEVMEKLAQSTFRKEVAVTRRQMGNGQEPSKTAFPSDDLRELGAGLKPAKTEKTQPSGHLDEVVFSIAPYLSGQKADPRQIKRRKPAVTRSSSNRKTA